jgi:hypothetical protein
MRPSTQSYTNNNFILIQLFNLFDIAPGVSFSWCRMQRPKSLWWNYMDAECFRAENRTGFLVRTFITAVPSTCSGPYRFCSPLSACRIQYVSVQPSITRISTVTFRQESAFPRVLRIRLRRAANSVISSRDLASVLQYEKETTYTTRMHAEVFSCHSKHIPATGDNKLIKRYACFIMS